MFSRQLMLRKDVIAVRITSISHDTALLVKSLCTGRLLSQTALCASLTGSKWKGLLSLDCSECINPFWEFLKNGYNLILCHTWGGGLSIISNWFLSRFNKKDFPDPIYVIHQPTKTLWLKGFRNLYKIMHSPYKHCFTGKNLH